MSWGLNEFFLCIHKPYLKDCVIVFFLNLRKFQKMITVFLDQAFISKKYNGYVLLVAISTNLKMPSSKKVFLLVSDDASLA